MKISSRWPTRILCAVLALWYGRFGLARRFAPAAPRRILIAHNLLLGDTIMLAPLMKKLRTRFRETEIVMTCKSALVPLFANRPYGVRAIAFDPRDVRTFFTLFRERGFDLALLPADNRLSWLARALDSRWIVAFEGDRPAYKNWLVDEFREFPDHLMALGDIFAECMVDGPPPEPYAVTEWVAPLAEAFALPPAPYGVVHLGAGSRLRYWDPDKWRALIVEVRSRGLRPVLTVGPGEEALLQQVDPGSDFTSFPGSLSLPQMWHLLAGAQIVVCPDTGVGHLARLAGVPVVVLFGPGSAKLFGGGEFWRTVQDRKVTIAKFPCRNENLVFRRHLAWAEHCGRGTSQCASAKCMQALSVEMVILATRELMEKQ